MMAVEPWGQFLLETKPCSKPNKMIQYMFFIV